ncbi:MAG: hypothetical protein ACKPKO_38865, partial [Candidatus Fonsibacter sp.]
LPPISEVISSTFCVCAAGIYLVFVKYTIFDASRVPEFFVHLQIFDILLGYIMISYKMSQILYHIVVHDGL